MDIDKLIKKLESLKEKIGGDKEVKIKLGYDEYIDIRVCPVLSDNSESWDLNPDNIDFILVCK